ncbi:alpha/beta hydrolase [Flavobacterium agrisoli]|uniref:Alpha/beta hydrolase n=1 Tax=Flavobacterium agrisoli TaxID=2793066 RepID=A0A934PJ72_9FLAO|nr:alpha/beta hydrolase [Flavobacterium agrisoli]MBK0369116.1 alpha/beta hydrolase [Flavobacterium agrisoli]
MIKYFTVIFFFVVVGYSQESLSYEKELTNKQNYNYIDVSAIHETENFVLRGSLTTPKSNFEKIVVIVPGAGKDTRNCHFVLAEDFLKKNIAVFRYDEKGLGASEGEYSHLKNGIISKAWDLYYLIKRLKEIDIVKGKKIVLLGHSEGGFITIGAIEKGAKVDYLLQWSTPIVSRGSLFKYQIKSGENKQEHNLKYSDDATKYAVIDSINNIVANNSELNNTDLRKVIISSMKKSGFKEKSFRWYITFPNYLELLRSDFQPTYKNRTIPMSYIIGSKDIHVDPIENVELLKSYNKSNIEIKVFEGLNHYLNNEDISVVTQDIYKINEKAEEYIIHWVLKQK